MELERIKILNFRNFQELDVNLKNRNVILGLNDAGKSNFLYAIRYLLDGKIRKSGFLESDYYNKNIKREIEITIWINIGEETDVDNKKLYSIIQGATDTDILCIKLIAEYDNDLMLGNAILKWGSDESELENMPSHGIKFAIDEIFNVVYIDSSVQLDKVFKIYTKNLLQEKNISEKERNTLDKKINGLNKSISMLENIKHIERDMGNVYKTYRNEKNIKINIKSEIELENIYSKLIPYISYNKNEYFPTSGDGRMKILEYTLLTLESSEVSEKKINIFLIEELENHLHRSMQIALSYQLFEDNLFKHMFITTHSDLIISQMDKVNLIKLLDKDVANGNALYYEVPNEYKMLKKKLNENLSKAIFYNTVLLVEGPSEKVLFEHIMMNILPKYESEGGYILVVDGINFNEYYRILTQLGITVIVKTDNDFEIKKIKIIKGKKQKYKCIYIGINRGLRLINMSEVNGKIITDTDKYDYEKNKISKQENFYDNQKSNMDILEKNKVFLSKVDLENDLYDVIPDVFKNTFNGKTKDINVKKMQKAKLINMINLCKNINKTTCIKIIQSERFKCIKELIENVEHK